LIADLTLSDISGDRLAHRCRQLRPDLPVILCAGSGPSLSEEEARARGIAELVHKPLRLHDLAHRIRRVLNVRPSAVPSSLELPIHGQV
jgi:CheY-like chemotaxis protein